METPFNEPTLTPFTRRSLLCNAAFASAVGAASVGSSPIVQAAGARPVPNGSVVLFQGDSITDAGRDRSREGHANDAAMFGRGYPFHIAAYALSKHPGTAIKIYNRGISGHKVPDLAARWDKDCLDLKPALVSILIGVNDIWHKLNGNYDGTVADYENGYNALLEQTKFALPETQIVVCEPFVLRCGAVNNRWFPEMDERRAAAKRVAEKNGALFVPFQQVFDDAVADGSEPAYWAGDGVHPTVAGHGLMAKAWIETVQA